MSDDVLSNYEIRDEEQNDNFVFEDFDEYEDHHEIEEPEGETREKPPFPRGKFLGRSFGRVSTGPAVEYVNWFFNVDSDRYTEETIAQVYNYQRENGLNASGGVNEALYNRL